MGKKHNTEKMRQNRKQKKKGKGLVGGTSDALLVKSQARKRNEAIGKKNSAKQGLKRVAKKKKIKARV